MHTRVLPVLALSTLAVLAGCLDGDAAAPDDATTDSAHAAGTEATTGEPETRSVTEECGGAVLTVVWSNGCTLEVPDGARDLVVWFELSAYSGEWRFAVTDPSGATHGPCADSCGPTVVNNMRYEVAPEDRIEAGAWDVDVGGAGLGGYSFGYSFQAPA